MRSGGNSANVHLFKRIGMSVVKSTGWSGGTATVPTTMGTVSVVEDPDSAAPKDVIAEESSSVVKREPRM